MKKIWLCLLLVLAAGCSTAPKEQQEEKPSYCDEDQTSTCGFGNKADMSEYEGFTEKDSMFEESDMKHLIQAFEKKGTGVFYLGFPNCPWCIEALPILNEVAKQEKISIAYIRTRDEKKELMYTPEEKKQIISYASEFLKKDKEGEYQLYVPFVVVVKDGKAIQGHIGSVDGHDAHERKMNESEKEQLKTIYTDMLAQVK